MRTDETHTIHFFTCIGLLCVIFPRQITAGLPYILGGTMAVAGITYIAAYFRSHAEADRSTELASGFVLLVIGILCVFHGAGSIGPLGTTWAIIGIRKASRSLSALIQDHSRGMGAFLYFAEFLVRFVFSVMLLFYPIEKFETHIMLLGLELIVVSVRLTKNLSPSLDLGE